MRATPAGPLRLGVALAAALFALAGCSTLSLFNDPMAPRGAGDNFRAPPAAIFNVEWWRPLVAPPMWEYAPRETASPAVDPDTGRVVTGTRDGKVRSFDANGNLEWTFNAK